MPHDQLLTALRQVLERGALAVKHRSLAVVQHILRCPLQLVVEASGGSNRRREVLVKREEELRRPPDRIISSTQGSARYRRLTASSPQSAHLSLIHRAETPARTSRTAPPTPAVAAVV